MGLAVIGVDCRGRWCGEFDLCLSRSPLSPLQLSGRKVLSPHGGVSANLTLIDIPQTSVLMQPVPKNWLAGFFISSQTRFFPPQAERQRSPLAPYSQLG